MDYRILGPLEASDGDRPITLGGEKQRALLAVLLLHAGEVVSADRLIDDLWGERVPAASHNALQVHVSRLRKALDRNGAGQPNTGADASNTASAGVVVTRGHGYVLRVEPGELDLDRFRLAVETGREALAAGDAQRAAESLRAGLALWRGPPLADFLYEPFASSAISELEELRLGAVEDRVEADLALGRHQQLVGELTALVAENPLRERLRGQLMLALYRCGRQAEALDVYQDLRHALAGELGLDPSPHLQQLQAAILARAPSLDAEEVRTPPGEAATRAARPRRTAGHHRRRALAVLAIVGIAVATALVVVLASGGSSSIRLAANDVGAIATGSGQVALALPVHTQPTSVAVGRDGATWVASASSGTLSRIDPKTYAVTQITVGSEPVAVAVAPDGTIWVANSGSGTVSRVSPQNNEVVGTVRVGDGPSALLATSRAVWVANTLSASVSKIDPASDHVVATIPVGSEPAGLAAGAGSVWVADQGDDTVYRLDQQTGAQDGGAITVGQGPIGVAFGDGAAWVVNSIDGTLTRIDAQSNSVSAIPVGQGPREVAVGSGQVWVSDEYNHAVVEVDPSRMTVVHTVQTTGAPLGLALAGGRLWVATDGIGAAAHRGGVLYAQASGLVQGTLYGDPDGFDPSWEYEPDMSRVLIMTSDGLVGYRRTGGVAGTALVPDLAVSLPVPTNHGLTYTFRIRPAIRYSNGAIVRAADFRRGLERMFKLTALGYYGPVQFFTSLVGGERCYQHPRACDLSHGIVTDNATDTVTFHLVSPDPELLYQLALTAADPVPAGTPLRLRRGVSVPGTGPYEISSYSPYEIPTYSPSNNPRAHGRLVLSRNPYFHQWSAAAQPAGFPDRIIVRTNYSPASQVASVEHGRADVAWDPAPIAELTSLSQNYPTQLHESTQASTHFLWLNVRRPPFDNLLARQAFSYAINRAALASQDVENLPGRPTCQLLPPDFPGYVPYCPYTLDPVASGRWLAPDLSKARALVRQSGTGGAQVIVLSVTDRGPPGPLVKEVMATLRSIGYRTTTENETRAEADGIDAQRFADRADTGGLIYGADYVAPSDFFGPTVTCTAAKLGLQQVVANIGRFCDPRLDARIGKALAEQAQQAGVATSDWTAIDRTVANEAAVVPIANLVEPDFVARRVGNYEYNPEWGVLIDQLWVR
jgi:peptide/nickel transport system substrate-binding protein